MSGGARGGRRFSTTIYAPSAPLLLMMSLLPLVVVVVTAAAAAASSPLPADGRSGARPPAFAAAFAHRRPSSFPAYRSAAAFTTERRESPSGRGAAAAAAAAFVSLAWAGEGRNLVELRYKRASNDAAGRGGGGGGYNYGNKQRSKANRATIKFSQRINQLANSREAGAAEEAEQMLFDMMDKIQTGQETEVKLNVIIFTAVIKSWERAASRGKKGQESADVADRAVKLLELMEKLAEAGDDAVRPDQFTYGSVLNALAKSGDAERAEELLIRMEAESNDNEDGGCIVRPNTIHYNTVLNAWANSRSPQAAERAVSLLKSMQSNYESSGDNNARPNMRTYSAAIKALGRSKVKGSAEKAEKLLLHAEKLYADSLVESAEGGAAGAEAEGGAGATLDAPDAFIYNLVMADAPDAFAYNLVINAWAKSSDLKQCGSRAEQLLRKMERKYIAADFDGSGDSMKPDLISYNSVLDAWANSNEDDAAERAGRIVAQMEDGEDDMTPPPDAVSYTNLIRAIARSGTDDCGERAEALLDRMVEREVKPTKVVTYNAVVDAWARAGAGEGRNGYKCACSAEKLVDRMKALYEDGENAAAKPNGVTYTSLIRAYGNCVNSPEAAAKVEHILDEMEQSEDKDMRPDAYAYTTAIGGMAASSGDPERSERILRRASSVATAATYAAAIKAWLTTSTGGDDEEGRERRIERAENLVREMLDLAEGGRLDARHTTSACSYFVRNALKNARDDAEEVAEEKEKGEEAMALVMGRVERLLSAMESSKNEELRPTTNLYNAVLRGLVDVGSIDRAEGLLSRMMEAESDGGGGDDEATATIATTTTRISTRPDADSYKIVIDGLEACDGGVAVEGAEERARELFWRMQELK